MNRKVSLLYLPVVVLAVVVVIVVGERRASACGGCFAPPGEFTAVDSHRMVIKVGLEETVLWDQFIYTGAPEEFAWVLPVPTSDVKIEVADSAFVQKLDEQTAPIVQPGGLVCATAGGCGFGGGGFGQVPIDGVKVYNQGVVGPYQTVTLGADDPESLYTWLTRNGYAFPESAIPTLDSYIANDSSFVALRLRPGLDVQAMQPVRIRFRGPMQAFPLKMVVIGAAGVVNLSLWIIAEQRYEPLNYPTVVIDEDELVWDWFESTSNYEQVFDSVIDRNGGRAWVTEYASVLTGSELAEILKTDAREDYLIATDRIDYPYITRIRTRMLVEHIDQDLQLAPAVDSTDVSRDLVALRSINGECTQTSIGGVGQNGAGQKLVLVLLCLIAVTASRGLRRRRSRCHPHRCR